MSNIKINRMEINMKKRAIVFPIKYESREIIQYKAMIENYDIVGGIVLERHDDVFAEEKIIEYENWEYQNTKYDVIILLNYVEECNLDIYKKLLQIEMSKNKEIVLSLDLLKLFESQLLKYTNKTIIKANKKIENEIIERYENDEARELKDIRTPIISVMGMGEYCNKFSCELELRNFFSSKGYKVLQIGSKKFSNLFGFEYLPEFMFKKIIH